MSEVDFSWVNATEPWERLRWARARKFDSGKAFADALGMEANTYRNHEREPGSSRSTALTAEKAMEFSRPLKVRWEWLLYGAGEPWLDPASVNSPRQRVIKALDAVPLEEQERIAAAVEALTRRFG